MDQINEQINAQINVLCLQLERVFKVDHKKLQNLWIKNGRERRGEEKGDTNGKIKYSEKYESNTVTINKSLFLICPTNGIFGKIYDDDVNILTEKDEELCVRHGFKIMKGVLNEQSIQVSLM